MTYDSRENCNAIIETATNTLITGCKNTIIPNSVTSIGNSAFQQCTTLTSITIPNSVTSIGDYAFYRCSKLKTLHVEATTPLTLGADAFSSSPTCYIPCGTLAAYRASDWAQYVGKFSGNCPPLVVKAKVPASWENDVITVWVWTDGEGTEYPTTKDGDWYVYTHTDYTDFNIIFKSGTGWKGNQYQTVDINGITDNTCLEIQPTNTKATYTIVDCPSITYELNGGVTNDYDWMSKDDMYHELLVDINAIMPTTKVDVDTVTLAYDKTKNIQEGIPTYWGSLDSLFTNFDFLSKWSWLINYMDSTCVLESKSLPSTSSAYLRFNLSAFFIEKERTAWPTTPDYSKYGLYSYYQPAWQHGFDNPTNPTEEFVLNAPYREGYTFAGWYTTPDFSGDKVTTINAETEGTLYAKWIDETWVIKYTSTDGNIVTPYATDVFGANIVNNTYEDGVGTLTFDGAVTCIGDSAFYNCDGLVLITIPNNVTSIGNNAFYNCDGLISMTIPNSVTSVGDFAFFRCLGFSSITIPNGVTKIGSHAFRECSSLKSITIPSSVMEIGRGAFEGAFENYLGLVSIIVDSDNRIYDSRENCNAIIETATNTLVVGCQNTIIPNSVTMIGERAFRGSTFTSITIPSSVTSIEYLAFFECDSLDAIYMEAITPPTLGNQVFNGAASFSMHIPCGTLAAYEASDWAQYVSEFIEEGCISFELNGGVVSAELPIYIASSYTLPTPTREGYIFRGWYDNPQGIGNRLSTLPAGYEGTIYAYWTKEPTDALNPFAYALSSELSQDKSQLLVNYSLNARATDVQIVIMDGETAVKTIACDGLSKGSHSIAIPTAGLPEHKQLTWKVEVKGAEVTEPTEYAVNYSFYYPSTVDIDNNPENPTFGMLLVNEGMQKVKDVEGYVSTGFGAGIFAFNPAFEPMPNGSNPGYNGGIEFTDKRADVPDSITSGTRWAYSPNRIRISEDGRIFVTSLNTDGNYLWEVNPENMNEWTSVFQGTLNNQRELVDAAGNFIAAPNCGFDVKGSGENLQLIMYSVNLPGITTAAMNGFRCDEYNLGTATEWTTAPSKNWVNALYAINYTGTQVEYDNEGGIWIASYRGTASDTNPGLVHINKDGVEDTKLVWSMLRNAGIRFNNDFTKLVIAGNNGAAKKATIYAISKDANGAPVLTEEAVIDMRTIERNLNDFAWDYAGNLYACGNAGEKLVAWAMPRSADEVVTTPAASKYNFTYFDDAITYELNGGVTNDYGWQSKDDMFQACMADCGVTTLPSLDEIKATGNDTALTTICTKLTDVSGILNSDKWEWLEAYIVNHQNADAAATKLTESTYVAGWRYAFAAFFVEGQRIAWPRSADFSKAGKDEAYIPAWRHAFDNPTNPAEEFVLNAPYKEGYTFAGWYTNADFSGEKVTTINAETEGTLYAKWIDETWQITYTSTDGNIVTPYKTDVFGANIVSNTYENGQGVITFDGPVTSIGGWAFYNCSSLTSITIPNSVTSIGERAFSYCPSLTSITIPDSVTSIGNFAFYKCSSLTSITIPNSVTSIGDYAFGFCSVLTSITIPNSVTSIGDRAFSYSGLDSITIPNSVTSIGDYAFGSCSCLTSIVVEGENMTYDSRENCNAIIETATNTLIKGCKNTIIPNSVTSIGNLAFYNCSSLTSITIPNSVTSIGERAFSYCPSLTSIVVEGGNATYDSRENCNAIIETATNTLIAGCKNTIIPNSVTSIGDVAFYYCSSLTSITIPNSMTSIGDYAFSDCSGLTSITIPNSVTSIGERAFRNCSSLDTIHIEAITPPTLGTDAVTSSPTCYIPCGTLAAYQASDWASQVSEFVEEGCAPIQMCGDNLFWEYADSVLTITGTGDMYDYAADTDVPWYDVRGNIKTVILPDAMTKIGQNAFYKCTAMTSINMPTSLTAIGEKAFAQDTKLACEIILPASMTTIASRAFFNCQAVTAFHIEATTPPTIPNDAFERTTAPIHVPCGYGHVYGKHTQWGMLNLEMCELLQDNVYYYPIDGHTARAVTYHSNPTDTIVIPSAVVIDGMPRTVTEVADFAFTDCANLPAIYFNEGLEYIGERAFVRCYGLHGTIVLPATLETIGERAFSYCDNVEKYLIQAMTPPALGDGAFTCANHDALFYVSCEVMDDYKVATNWSSLKSRFRDACLNIYHYNTALGANGVHTTEDTLVASIYYRRQFTPYRWETLYLPFEVDRVTVLENGLEYDLTAWDIVDGGHYFLAKPDGMLNKEILFGFTDELESHTPYIIQFSDAYYTDKIITFYGKESWNKLSSSFEVLSSSSWMQIAGNTTMQDQLLEKPVYMLRSGLDFILQKTTTTLHPFECYVMPYTAQSGAPARMNVRLRDDVATAVESVKGNESHLTYTVDGYTLTVYPQGQAFSIYSLNGALIYSCGAGKEAVDCELNSGCYLLHAGTEAHKIML